MDAEVGGTDKHSSLLQYGINYSCEKSFDTSLWKGENENVDKIQNEMNYFDEIFKKDSFEENNTSFILWSSQKEGERERRREREKGKVCVRVCEREANG